MLNAFYASDIGQNRKENQDYIFASESKIGSLPNLFIVADGMGGHKAGDFASKATVDTMVESIGASGEKSPVLVLKNAIEEANRLVCTKAMENASMEGMGTTVVAAAIIGNRLQVANVGDSRLYVIRDVMNQITIDHSLVEEMIRVGTIDREMARNHPSKNIITRAVGVSLEIQPDFFTVTLQKGDLVLLCTDGLTNMLEDEEIFEIVKKTKDAQDAVPALIAMANRRGGKDNISVILVDPAL